MRAQVLSSRVVFEPILEVVECLQEAAGIYPGVLEMDSRRYIVAVGVGGFVLIGSIGRRRI